MKGTRDPVCACHWLHQSASSSQTSCSHKCLPHLLQACPHSEKINLQIITIGNRQKLHIVCTWSPGQGGVSTTAESELEGTRGEGGQLATLCQVTATLLAAGWTRHAASGGSAHPHAASVSVIGASKASALHATAAAEATTRTSSATTRSATSAWSAITATRLLLLYVQTVLPIELDWLKHAQTSVNSCSSTPSSSPHLNRYMHGAPVERNGVSSCRKSATFGRYTLIS